MIDKEKLVIKFLTDRMHITVDDCDRLLTGFGYELHKKGGSHLTYHKKGAIPITIVIPKKRKYIVSLYVNRIVKDLKLESQNDNSY
jgi:predicted RNA binding protein YcfA (HicA-like mRNA interferase family)